MVLSGTNTYQGGTTVAAGTLVVASSNAYLSATALTVASGATFQLANHAAGATVVPIVRTFSNSGTIDLMNNAMVLQNSSGSISTINREAANAYNGGAWNGSGAVITSSVAANDAQHLTAVGVGTGFTSFEGLNGSSGDVLLKYIYYGDANLDGKVDGCDYSYVDNAYLNHLSDWSNGDFNYDGVVDGSDYTLIDNAFNSQGAVLTSNIASFKAMTAAQISTTAAVPEPALSPLLCVMLASLCRRRRRGPVEWLHARPKCC